MTRTASSDDTPTEPSGSRPDRKAVEAALAKAALLAVAMLFCVEIVSTAEPDAPVYQATFDVTPPVDTAPPQPDTGSDWRPVHVAHGPDTLR